MKRFLNILPELILILFIIITVALVSVERNKLTFSKFHITIQNTNEYSFIENNDVISIVKKEQDSIERVRIKNIRVLDFENAIKNHSSVRNCDVFCDLNGILHIDIEQREPIIRIINSLGDGFYFDKEGTLMPLSVKYNARVAIANGNISVEYKKRLNVANKDSISAKYYVLHEVYLLAKLISEDAFLNKLIEQIYVTKTNQFILTPKLGPKEIEFGGIDNFEYKMNKLKIFYKEGFKKKGYDVYNKLNLKHSNQVIATKIR